MLPASRRFSWEGTSYAHRSGSLLCHSPCQAPLMQSPCEVALLPRGRIIQIWGSCFGGDWVDRKTFEQGSSSLKAMNFIARCPPTKFPSICMASLHCVLRDTGFQPVRATGVPPVQSETPRQMQPAREPTETPAPYESTTSSSSASPEALLRNRVIFSTDFSVTRLPLESRPLMARSPNL